MFSQVPLNPAAATNESPGPKVFATPSASVRRTVPSKMWHISS
jgi:hypothetical protein